MPANSADKPAVDFNFDTFVQEGAPQPYAVVIGGKRYESVNPLDLDYRQFEEAEENTEEMFKLLFPEDHEKILANRISVAALLTFTNKVRVHYGLNPTDES